MALAWDKGLETRLSAVETAASVSTDWELGLETRLAALEDTPGSGTTSANRWKLGLEERLTFLEAVSWP